MNSTAGISSGIKMKEVRAEEKALYKDFTWI